MKDSNYTEMWTEKKFTEARVNKYHSKFFRLWQKHVKHYDQVKAVKKMLSKPGLWADCPIGSGRLFETIEWNEKLGLDISESFLTHNRLNGIECEKVDLNELAIDARFDYVTSLHTLAAFSNFEEIVEKMIRSLKPGGKILCDLPMHELEINNTLAPKLWLQQRLETWDCELISACPHDFWDSAKINHLREPPSTLCKKAISRLWAEYNRVYFKLKLGALMSLLSRGWPNSFYDKYLIILEKRK